MPEAAVPTQWETQKSSPLIRTKLRVPLIRSELVARPRLQEKIAQGLRGPLTLITAPAGFGKTTLVASCLTGSGMPVAWLSLDKHDNEARRFLAYVVAALREADGAIGGQAEQLLALARQIQPEAVLTMLINDLDSAAREIVLVLDDYQFLKDPTVHQAVGFLLEHCPRTLHLVIVTRSDPMLPIARLRARGQLIELRAVDLSFSDAEAANFLTDIMGLRLEAGAIAALAEHTEGWVAGLQMAALAILGTFSKHGGEELRRFIDRFSGTNRYILDYLLEEVLSTQPPAVQRFLLHTSILERLTAPLCDVLMARGGDSESEGAGERTDPGSFFASDARAILAYLEHANLFVMPLDDERIWYRYHHLFADLLRAQLQTTMDAKGVAQLHVQAAEWHGQNGSVLEAIHHASMALDDKRVERFIEQHYMELVSHGEQSWLRSWKGALSKEVVYRRPWLCIYEAYSHSWFGELDEADHLLAEAEKRIKAQASDSGTETMQGLLAYVKSRVTAMRGDIQRAIELCLYARKHVPASNQALQLDTRITLGYEFFLSGDYDAASTVLDETIRLGRAVGAIINTVAASCLLARLFAVQGQLNRSYATYELAAECIGGATEQHLGARALLEVGIADVLYERNELDAALRHLQRGLDMLPFWDKADDWILAHIAMARIRLAQLKQREAAEAVEKARYLVQTRGIFSEARHVVEAAQVRLWLAQSDLHATGQWAAAQEERSGAGDPFNFQNELAHIARARVLLAQNRPGEAIDLLSHVEETARSAGRMGRVIEVLLLEALGTQQKGDSPQALRTLTECLTLAEPETYVRLFLDEGQPMQMLLAHWLARAGTNPLRAYVIRLLAHFEAEPTVMAAPQAQVSPIAMLVEPVSPRELEVLHLMALGRTNREIAEQLIVATGTVKAHTSNIYRKLDVSNRTQAVARAKELGILP